ncbi:MAG: ABC transporter substrate-binding protein [Castellaniella sp.]|uniref:ABC transporter substrate-binding protein n=1 Tax=Castellaniella sp. TaxID=1955812 RepID=UPI002A35E104|nr:ABC transporter substrate-binding protein [Castellaniella sp.]MDY0309720.1 ABC transporter substrate-binding protein [Castellaniella sp.]
MLKRILNCGALLVGLLAWSVMAASAPLTLQDMAGRQVTLTAPSQRLATLGAVPVINSMVFALGAGDRIINGLPDFAQHSQWAYQYQFAPHLRTLPTLQNPDRSVRIEALVQAKPDLALTMDRRTADQLQSQGIPTLVLAWRNPEDVRQAIDLLGQALGRTEQAQRYRTMFDDTLALVRERLQAPGLTPPRVLYLNPRSMTRPHRVAEWWITAAGGQSVTNDHMADIESRAFGPEQILAWNPEIMIVANRRDAELLLHDPRLARVQAIQDRRIVVTPTGAHMWGNRTAEQALAVLWAASVFHPDRIDRQTLTTRVTAFYQDLYGTSLTPDQIDEILAGGPDTPSNGALP